MELSKKTITSLEVAELSGKNHKDVLRSIKNMEPAWNEVTGRNFALSTYNDASGKSNPVYNLTKEECLFIASKFNDVTRAKLVKRWMELELQKQESAELSEDEIMHKALTISHRRLEAAQETIAKLNETIKEQAPAIEYVGEVLESNSAHTITTIAKELGMSGQKLNDLLCEKKVQYRHDGHYVLYAKYQNMGYTKTRTHTYTDKYGKEQTQIQTVWTEKGRQLIHLMFNPKLNAQ